MCGRGKIPGIVAFAVWKLREPANIFTLFFFNFQVRQMDFFGGGGAGEPRDFVLSSLSDGKDWSRRNCRSEGKGKCGLRKKTVLPGGFWSNPSQWGKRISLKSAYSYLFLCYFSKERKRILLKYLGKFVGNSADADARRKIFSRPAAGMPAKSFKSSFSTPPPFPPSLSVRT